MVMKRGFEIHADRNVTHANISQLIHLEIYMLG